MSRPASQDQYRAEAKQLAGRVGSIELLGGEGIRHCSGEERFGGMRGCSTSFGFHVWASWDH